MKSRLTVKWGQGGDRRTAMQLGEKAAALRMVTKPLTSARYGSGTHVQSSKSTAPDSRILPSAPLLAAARLGFLRNVTNFESE